MSRDTDNGHVSGDAGQDLSFPFGFDARAAWAARSESDRILRRLLALAYSGPTGLYSDDGELQDNRRPWIDYVRDSAADIERAIFERGRLYAEAHADEIRAAFDAFVRSAPGPLPERQQ